MAKKQEGELLKKNNAANRKLIINMAKQYTNEYEDQVSFLVRYVLQPATLVGLIYVK